MIHKASTAAVTASLLLGMTSAALAEIETTETLVHETTTPVELELNDMTVICSFADYGSAVLKVLIPELASITLLDHQNFGAGAPCVAAGQCAPFGDSAPEDILSEGYPTELVAIQVQAIRIDRIDHELETCTVSLKETVDLDIRGVPFTHARFAELGSRLYSDCISSTIEIPSTEEPTDPTDPVEEVPTDDVPADSPGSSYGASDDTKQAGCSAATGTAGGGMLALLFLGMVVGRRRSRRG